MRKSFRDSMMGGNDGASEGYEEGDDDMMFLTTTWLRKGMRPGSEWGCQGLRRLKQGSYGGIA